MRDFFAVSHKYRLLLNVTTRPQLFTKSWHLNDIIKKLIAENQHVEPSVYNVIGDTLYVISTDSVSSNLLNVTDAAVSSDVLELGR